LKESGIAVLNNDDAYVRDFAEEITEQEVILFGRSPGASVTALNVESNTDFTRFNLRTPLGSVAIQSPLLGDHNVENLLAARHIHLKSNFLQGMIYAGPTYREEIKHRAVAEQIIAFLELQPIRNKHVGSLPYGLRKRVELGRALAMEPQLLLLDEPMAGMNVEEKEDMARFIIDINEERGTTILLIEHDMGVVMDIATHVAVLEFGRKIAEGTPAQVKANPEVIRAYLGADQGAKPVK